MKLKACAVNKRFARRTAMAIGMRAKDLCNFFGIRWKIIPTSLVCHCQNGLY